MQYFLAFWYANTVRYIALVALVDLVKISFGMLSGPRNFPSVKDIMVVSGSFIENGSSSVYTVLSLLHVFLNMFCPSFVFWVSFTCLVGFFKILCKVFSMLVRVSYFLVIFCGQVVPTVYPVWYTFSYFLLFAFYAMAVFLVLCRWS